MQSNTGNSSKMETDERMDLFRSICRQAGLRITPQRTTIYKELIESKDHPSADVLCRRIRKKLPNVSLDTVNRTLLTLADIGAAYVVAGSGDPKRFEGNLHAHQHFKCVKCRRIVDFHYEPFDHIDVPPGMEKKFTVLRSTVYFEGICEHCRKSD